jgi:predicted metal-dependent peptidase
MAELKKFDITRYTNKSLVDYISKAKFDLRNEFPFYGYLTSRLRWVVCNDINTAGVDGSRNLYYNEEFFNSLSTDEVEKIYKIQVIGIHEVLHLAFNHPCRRGNRNAYIETPEQTVTVWNIACDIVVNNMIVRNNFQLMEGTIIPHDDEVMVFGVKIENISKKNAEDIYSELVGQMKKNEKNNDQGDSQESKNGNGQGKGIKTDKHAPKEMGSHERWDEGQEDKDSKGQDMKDSWKKAVYTAYEYAKQQGKSPLGMDREFDAIGRSRIKWDKYIRREVSKTIPYMYDWTRPHKKYLWQDIFVPSYQGEKVQVLVDIDTSGSMSNKELGTIISELIGIGKTYKEIEFRILTHDTEVHTDVLLTGKTEQQLREIELKGGGGSDHKATFEYIQNKKYAREGKLLITFTDGYTSWPEKPVRDFNTICVLVGGHCPKEQVPSWIKTIILE